MNPKLLALPVFAQSFVGISDTDPSGLALVSEFRRTCGDSSVRPASWCLAYVQFCIRQVDRMFGGTQTLLPMTEWTVGLAEAVRFDAFALPEVGHIALWQEMGPNGMPLSSGHCAIVSGVDGSTNIATIEGNTSSGYGSNQRHSGCISEKLREKSQIPGFILKGFVNPW